jgi:hypothetical protein
MEKRLLKEQKGFHSYHTNSHVGASGGMMNSARTEPRVPARARVVVKSPKPVPASTWTMRADRRAQLRRRPGETYTVLVPRTLQADMTASSGRLRAIRQAQLRQSGTTPVPVRSGRYRRRSGFFARVLALLVVLAIGAVGVNFALTSTGFRVEQVSVVGTQNPALVNYIEQMGIQGQNIFLVDTDALAARIEMMPLVALASVEKQWPNSVTVTVVERVAVLLWQTNWGTYSVDRQGVVIAPVNETLGADQLMTVLDTRGQAIRPGTRLNAADVAFALQVFAQLPRMTSITHFTLAYASVDVAGTGAGGSYVVQDAGGWKAYLGSANDANPLGNRLLELQQILVLAQKQQLNLATIDLRFGLRPVYTVKS